MANLPSADMRDVYRRLHEESANTLFKDHWNKVTWPFIEWVQPLKHTPKEQLTKRLSLEERFITSTRVFPAIQDEE